MKKFVFMVSFSLMILATLLLAGCGNQKTFAGQASGIPQLASSGFQCSDGEDCGFVTDGWVLGKIRNALSNYVDQQGLSNALSGYATGADVNSRFSNLGIDCQVFQIQGLSPSGSGGLRGNDFCQTQSRYNSRYNHCINVGYMANNTYFDSTNGLCDGASQLTLTSTRLASCDQDMRFTSYSNYCGRNIGGAFAEPLAGDYKSNDDVRFATCCRITG